MRPARFPVRFRIARRVFRFACLFASASVALNAARGSGNSLELGSDIRVWYRIGTIDPRHGISEAEVREIARAAERMWEHAIGRNLVHYDGTSSFEINILWGELSEWNAARAEAYAVVHGSSVRVDAAERKLTEAYKRTQQVETAYVRDFDAHTRELEAHNAEVSRWNREGGAPEDIYRRLGKQAERLREDAAALEVRRREYNRQVGYVNQLRVEYEKRIAEHNRSLAYFRERFPGARTMDQGLYRGDGIDVYYFEDADDLRITIAHELGHALGIGHTDDPGTLMYPLKSDKNGHLDVVTEVDLRYLREALENPPDFARIWWEHYGAGRRFQRVLPGIPEMREPIVIPWVRSHDPRSGHLNCCENH